jgi:hypothetical protein
MRSATDLHLRRSKETTRDSLRRAPGKVRKNAHVPGRPEAAEECRGDSPHNGFRRLSVGAMSSVVGETTAVPAGRATGPTPHVRGMTPSLTGVRGHPPAAGRRRGR